MAYPGLVNRPRDYANENQSPTALAPRGLDRRFWGLQRQGAFQRLQRSSDLDSSALFSSAQKHHSVTAPAMIMSRERVLRRSIGALSV